MCLQKYGCDFETPCEVINFDNFWGLTSGEVPFGPNAPNHDHTYGNSSGHYMFFDLNSGPDYTNPTVNFVNLFNNTLTKPSNIKKCLQFYYILKSEDNRNLTVQLVLGKNDAL